MLDPQGLFPPPSLCRMEAAALLPLHVKRARASVQVRLPHVYGRGCRETCLDSFFDVCSAPAPGLLVKNGSRRRSGGKRRAGSQTVKGKSRRARPNNDGSPDGHDVASCCASGHKQSPGSPSIITNASQPTAKYMPGTGRRPRRGSLRMGTGYAPVGSKRPVPGAPNWVPRTNTSNERHIYCEGHVEGRNPRTGYLRSMNSIRYPSGSLTKKIRLPLPMACGLLSKSTPPASSSLSARASRSSTAKATWL